MYFVFVLRRYLFIFIHDQLGAYVIRGLLDLIAADAERSQRCFYTHGPFIAESRQFKLFEMKVLHGVLEDIGVEMSRA